MQQHLKSKYIDDGITMKNSFKRQAHNRGRGRGAQAPPPKFLEVKKHYNIINVPKIHN